MLDFEFPLYRMGKFIDIYTTPLGVKKITTVKKEYILDDPSLPGDFAARRLKLRKRYGKDALYHFKERVDLLRQLVKFPGNTAFIDKNGKLIRYVKTSKLYEVRSLPIVSIKEIENIWSVITVKGISQKFLIGFDIKRKYIKYASIMFTKDGPFLYDLTTEPHEVYRRKI